MSELVRLLNTLPSLGTGSPFVGEFLPGEVRGEINNMTVTPNGVLRMAGNFYGLTVDGVQVFYDGNGNPSKRLDYRLGGGLPAGSELALPDAKALSTARAVPQISGDDAFKLGLHAGSTDAPLPDHAVAAIESMIRASEESAAPKSYSESVSHGPWTMTPLTVFDNFIGFDIEGSVGGRTFELVGGVGGMYGRVAGSTDWVQMVEYDMMGYPRDITHFDGTVYVAGKWGAYVEHGASLVVRYREGKFEQVGDYFAGDSVRLAVALVDGEEVLFARLARPSRGGKNALYRLTVDEQWQEVLSFSRDGSERDLFSLGDVLVTPANGGIVLVDPKTAEMKKLKRLSAVAGEANAPDDGGVRAMVENDGLSIRLDSQFQIQAHGPHLVVGFDPKPAA